MIRNNLKLAVRNLIRNRGYAAINISGIGVGISVFLLLWLFISDELSFNSYHRNAQNIYRIYEEIEDPNVGQKFVGWTSMPLVNALVRDMPEVIDKVNITVDGGTTITSGENKFLERNYFIADPNLFDVFDFTVISGNPKKVVNGQAGAVLTKSTALKFYGHFDVVGDILEVDRFREVEITAIIEDIPANSDLPVNILYVTDYSNWSDGFRSYIKDWNRRSSATSYVLLAEGTDPSTIMARKETFLKKYMGEDWQSRNFHLQPLADVHLKSTWIEDQYPQKGDILYIYIFFTIGSFVLLIACINYINLATAHSLQRVKEVGVRKVVGASKKQIIVQFLVEAMVISLISTLLAVGIIEFTLPYFNLLAEKELAFNFFEMNQTTFLLMIIGFGVGLISGLIPAIMMSRVKSGAATKSLSTSKGTGLLTRKGLVILQFTISIILISSTIVVLRQMNFVSQASLGFDKDQLLVIDINSSRVREEFQAVKNELSKNPGIKNVTATSRVPGEWKMLQQIDIKPQSNKLSDIRLGMHYMSFDEDAIATFNFELAEGSNFGGNVATDSVSVLINETAVEALGLDSPIGDKITVLTDQGDLTYRIIGVLKDFHYQSLYEDIGPLVIGHRTNPIQIIDYFTVKLSSQNYIETIAYAHTVNDRFSPERPMEYNFLDDQIDRFYKKDEKRGQLTGLASGIAILIACLGLFGLASFTAQQRTKEFGVRKVLGASSRQLVILMSREYVTLISVAFILATPISWFFMNQWLADFSYRISLGWGVFILSGMLALLTALLTVTYKSSKVASANPVDSLRYE